MNKRLYPEEAVQAIADAIRNVSGTTDKMKIGDMAGKITDDTPLLKQVIEGTLTEFESNIVTQVWSARFAFVSNLKKVILPNCTFVNTQAFYSCTGLTEVSLPVCNELGQYAFYGCSSLETIDFPALTKMSKSVFTNCSSLKALILRSETLITNVATGILTGCYHFLGTTNATYNPDGAKDGYVYVPSVLVDSYKSAKNWSTYASQFRALEDYTVDGTITGALDESKI